MESFPAHLRGELAQGPFLLRAAICVPYVVCIVIKPLIGVTLAGLTVLAVVLGSYRRWRRDRHGRAEG